MTSSAATPGTSGAESFVAFVEFLLPEVGIEFAASDCSESTDLNEDLMADSLQAWEIIVATEQRAGLLIPLDALPEIHTLGDAYSYYLAAHEAAIRKG